MEKAKSIARNALGLSDDFQLESVNVPEKNDLLLETVEYDPSKTCLFIFHAQNPEKPKLILS
jgi:hypothetical protein